MKIKIGNISHMIVHYVGNKSRDEGVSFSEKELDYTDISSDITSMLVKSFDTKEPCHFYFESTLALNPIYTFVKTIFEDASRFQEQSEFIAKILIALEILRHLQDFKSNQSLSRKFSMRKHPTR